MNSGLSCLVCGVLASLCLTGAAAQDGMIQPKRQVGSSAFVKITPESLDFGSQSVGTATQPKTATLANTGTSTLTLTDIVTSGIDFSQTNDCGQNLAPGATCTIQVTFKPAVTGQRMATLQILDSDPASPQSMVLTGTGQ